jgi:hypothetical protein
MFNLFKKHPLNFIGLVIFKKTLPVFSYLFHPIFIPFYAALHYFFCNNSYYSDLEKYVAILQIVIITAVLPLLFFFILRATGQADSIMLATISQRKTPLLMQCFLTFVLLRKSITLEHYPEFHYFFWGALSSIVIALIILFFSTKASLHMIAISAWTVFVIGLSIHNQNRDLIVIAFLVLMNGFVASSRLALKAHTPKELVIGFLAGILPQLCLFMIWL